jgi:hypothetical protein
MAGTTVESRVTLRQRTRTAWLSSDLPLWLWHLEKCPALQSPPMKSIVAIWKLGIGIQAERKSVTVDPNNIEMINIKTPITRAFSNN